MKDKTAFFNVVGIDEAIDAFREIPQVPTEEVVIEEALDRPLAEEITAADDIPHFDRAIMDGYALRAADTFGCSESQPAYLTVTGAVEMGQAVDNGPAPGEAWAISTGGMLPPGSDAVVMWEHTRESDGLLEVYRPVAAGENRAVAGEDVARGETVFSAGHRIRPADIGMLAGLGRERVTVRRRPRVAIVSTGDELLPHTSALEPGRIRNVNQSSLSAWAAWCGADPIRMGLIPDELDAIKKSVADGLRQADMVIISGGSSAGRRDLTREVVASAGEPGLLFHGLAVRPGKPTVIGASGRTPVIGLPGHPVSAMVVFLVLVRPILNGMQGLPRGAGTITVRARLADNIPSQAGREDFVQVALEEKDGVQFARPVFRKSGLVISMVRGSGMVRVPRSSEGLEEGTDVDVEIFAR